MSIGTRAKLALISAISMCWLVTACGGGSECGDAVCDGTETADSCAADCGCGNGIANPGEDCDGADLAGGSCMSETQRGGTLRCNANCTFDVTACTMALCGNGIVEDDELCDGADLGGGTCESLGFSSGDVACTPDCTYDTSTCCFDNCPAEGQSNCVGNSVRECTMAPSGCLAWEVTDCGMTGGVCESSGATAVCSCIDRCPEAGDVRCDGSAIEICSDTGGCLDWVVTSDCAMSGEACAEAPSGPVCVPNVTAEDCADAYELSLGDNILVWTANDADYLISPPSCTTVALDGPDLVMSYTATESGVLRVTMDKPASNRHVMVASAQACGTLRPEAGCVSDLSSTSMSTEIEVAMGSTYYFYVRDNVTTTDTQPLNNPLFVTVDQTSCTAITPAVTAVSPADGDVNSNPTPVFTADFNYPIDHTSGTITLTGSLGTTVTYDLATEPIEVAVTNGGKTLVIDPGIVFALNQSVSVTWSGIDDRICGKPIAPPSWAFQISGPPCTPGQDGMIGTTMTMIPTGLGSSFTENFLAVDTNPNGYVYAGSTSALYRFSKTGGFFQDVELAAGLGTGQLGYDMLVDGDQIFTLESTSSDVTTGHLWRITTDGGATWATEDYMTLPSIPTDDFRSITKHGDRYYILTHTTASTLDQIWSVPARAATGAQPALLEGTIPGETSCSGLAMDDAYYYLLCSTGARLLRVNRATMAVELLTDGIPNVSATKNAIHAHDTDNDGLADALYVQTQYERVHYVCDPGGAGPYHTDVLVDFGSASGNYGLAFDRVNNVLWAIDDDAPSHLVKIE